MIDVRRGTPADAPELVRLRAVMLGAMGGGPVPPGPWQGAAETVFRTRLAARAAETMVAFVLARPDDPERLAACAVGLVEQRLSSPANPVGQVGYILNVATDEAYRRRGFSRACVEALLHWYANRGVPVVDLRASDDGQPLYESLGFRPDARTMRFVG